MEKLPKQEKQWAEYLIGDTWELPADHDVIDSAENELSRRLVEAGVSESEVLTIQMPFREALINAIKHGTEEQLQPGEDIKTKRIFVSLNIKKEKNSVELNIVVRDQGKGFDPNNVPNPLAEENILKGSGRGILLMRSMLDSVDFNDAGNEVTLRKRFETQ